MCAYGKLQEETGVLESELNERTLETAQLREVGVRCKRGHSIADRCPRLVAYR